MLQLHCPLLSSWHTWEKIMSVKTEAKRPLSTLPSVNLLSVFAITFLCSTVLSSLPFQLKPEDSEMPEAFHFPFHCLHCTVMNYQRQYQPQGNTLTLFSWRNTVPGSWIPAKLESWCWFGNSWTTNLVLQFASHVTRLWGKNVWYCQVKDVYQQERWGSPPSFMDIVQGWDVGWMDPSAFITCFCQYLS